MFLTKKPSFSHKSGDTGLAGHIGRRKLSVWGDTSGGGGYRSGGTHRAEEVIGLGGHIGRRRLPVWGDTSGGGDFQSGGAHLFWNKNHCFSQEKHLFLIIECWGYRSGGTHRAEAVTGLGGHIGRKQFSCFWYNYTYF